MMPCCARQVSRGPKWENEREERKGMDECLERGPAGPSANPGETIDTEKVAASASVKNNKRRTSP